MPNIFPLHRHFAVLFWRVLATKTINARIESESARILERSSPPPRSSKEEKKEKKGPRGSASDPRELARAGEREREREREVTNSLTAPR